MTVPVLYDYWRSSASYRVRIALNMIGIDYRAQSIDLLEREHRSAVHVQRNPQGLVPALDIDGHMLTQSLAIIEYLDETRQAGLLPKEAIKRQRVRALAAAIAMEIHPICNTSVAAYVMELTGGGDAVRRAWMQKFIGQGLKAFEMMLENGETGLYCHGDTPGLADICLVPQIYNAERWGADLSGCPKLVAIAERCNALKPFSDAHPDAVNG